MTTRWSPSDTFDVGGVERSIAELLQTRSDGMIDLWNAIPAGSTIDAKGMAALRQANQQALADGLTLLQQQVTVAAGLGPGFRPEIFDQIRDLPGLDTVAATAIAALEGRLDLATLSKAAKDALLDVVTYVGNEAGIADAVADYLGGATAVVQLVWNVIETIVEQTAIDRALEESAREAQLACVPPAYSAELDQAEVDAALEVLAGSDWRDLFLPVVRPFDPELAELAADFARAKELPRGPLFPPGFTCCATDKGWRVVAPVGSGVGNRVQRDWPANFYGSSFGFGLLPMCPQMPCHRAIINRGQQQIFDPSQSLPMLAGLGAQAWRLLWGRGPAAFAVDGASICDAWAEYLSIMRRQIAGNTEGIGGFEDFGFSVCDDWSGGQAMVEWLFQRVGMPKGSANPDGIVDFSQSLPCKAWSAFDDYQTALLDRLVVAYVDADNCAPEWRARVAAAQAELLMTPSVCDVIVTDVPNAKYRAAVEDAKRARGAQCFVAGKKVSADWRDGPSLAPFRPGAPRIPSFPKPPVVAAVVGRPQLTGAQPSGGGAAAVVIGGAGLFLALKVLL